MTDYTLKRIRDKTTLLMDWANSKSAELLALSTDSGNVNPDVLKWSLVMERMHTWPMVTGPTGVEKVCIEALLEGIGLLNISLNKGFRQQVLVGTWQTSMFKVSISFMLPYLATSHITFESVEPYLISSIIDSIRIVHKSSSGSMRTSITGHGRAVSVRGVKASAVNDILLDLAKVPHNFRVQHVNLAGSTLLFHVYRQGKLVTCTPTLSSLEILTMCSSRESSIISDSRSAKIYGSRSTATHGTHINIDTRGSICFVGHPLAITSCYANLLAILNYVMINDINANRLIGSLRVL